MKWLPKEKRNPFIIVVASTVVLLALFLADPFAIRFPCQGCSG
jgi:hypothetical protein